MDEPKQNRSSTTAALVGVVVVAAAFAAGIAVRRTPVFEAPTAVPSAGIELVDATARAGIRHDHRTALVHSSIESVGPFIRAMIGAAVAVADVDGDGHQDLFFASGERGSANALYRNRGDGTFEDHTDAAGLAAMNDRSGTLRPLFADFDNDGDRDLFAATTRCPELWLNDGAGKFTRATEGAGLDHCGVATAANLIDLERDGDLDLVVADFFPPVDLEAPEHYEFMPHAWFSAENGGPVTVYRNRGDATFERVEDALGIETTGWAHAVGVYDLDDDGYSDVFFALDFNFSDRLYLGGADGTLVDASDRLDQKYSHSSMSAEVADYRNDGGASVYVTHIHEPGWVPSENVLWSVGADSVRNIARDAGVARCGFAWGAKFADLDNDGWQDLVVTNGFLSKNPGRSYWYPLSVLVSAHGNITRDPRRWPAVGEASMSGYQRPCVFRNRGGAFEDVTELTGMAADRSDGRGLAVVDLFGDGRLSVVQTALGQPAKLFANEREVTADWIGFELVGTVSGTDALGTRVTVVTGDGVRRTRELRPANGYVSQSDPRLHFGLGTAAVGEVSVRWPSGAVQDLGAPEVGRYHRLVEPS